MKPSLLILTQQKKRGHSIPSQNFMHFLTREIHQIFFPHIMKNIEVSPSMAGLPVIPPEVNGVWCWYGVFVVSKHGLLTRSERKPN